VTEISIEGGRTLIGGEIQEASLRLAGDKIRAVDSSCENSSPVLDASDLLVLPGIVDLHGDAFERQIMPRPGVDFPLDVALVDSDRQAIGNGITTVYHGATWSWEPGLRSADNAKRLLTAIETLRPRLAADTRFHLRHETYNLDAESDISQWLADRRIDLFAFNNHIDQTVANLDKPHKRSTMVERSGLTGEAFDRLVERVVSRGHEVAASIERLAEAARAANVRMLSHDDASPAMRKSFRALGAAIAEFPINEETAREAIAAGDFTVFGAPNVVRGGSHTGWTKAADMVAKGLCSILASDYYYPAQLLAAFRLASDDVLPLAQAWNLISANPARAAGLSDRGVLAPGYRADLILVDDELPLRPRIVATIAAGRLVHLTDANRLSRATTVRPKAVAIA
jgi:alpha-D-ribose 1-methylphosphonate 5-triphosphate diphosphatase